VTKVGYDWVGFLTDYGRQDGFVAACHGVIAQRAPSVRVIDITHEIPAQDVRQGAAVLAQTVPYLPPAVIVGVVDPGVGTARRGVAVAAGESILVGPDNGLLGWAAETLGGAGQAVALEATRFQLPHPSGTFDGRDVFAPVAAHLALGVPLGELGSPVGELVTLPTPVVEVGHGELVAEVLTVDHFGNVQLACRSSDLEASAIGRQTVTVSAGQQVVVVARGVTFADVPPGQVVCLVDSAGRLALAVNHGSAADALRLRPGDRVHIS
jgi:S-adenosylmethionine hydrolase